MQSDAQQSDMYIPIYSAETGIVELVEKIEKKTMKGGREYLPLSNFALLGWLAPNRFYGKVPRFSREGHPSVRLLRHRPIRFKSQ
jgi:hypothetical protein